MKLRSLIASVAMIAAAKAATITVTNVDFTQTNAIVSQTGTKLANGTGFVGIGVFSITDAQIAAATSSSTIANGFTLFGQSNTIGSGFAIDGTYQFESTAAIGAASPFTGNIYTVIGNAATLAASTQFLVFKEAVTFNPDPAASGPAVVKAGQGTVILGGFNNFQADIGLPSGSASAYNTVTLIPEPSAALLGLLGAVGLVRRRR